MKLIDGRAVAKHILDKAAHERALLGFTPGFAAVIVGDDPASHTYVSLKEKACRGVGIVFERLFFAADAAQGTVARAIENLNRRPDIDAILVQLPLPEHIDTDTIIRTIDPSKDVDGFHPENVALLKSGAPRIVPGLAAGVLALIKSTGESLTGHRALVVSNSRTFYEPLETVLSSAGMLPFYAPPHTPDLATQTRMADVLIVSAGHAGFITTDMVKPGAIIIDIGTNRVAVLPGGKKSKTVGDVAPEAAKIAAHVTPVPGGVGPVTVAMVVRNCVELAKKRRG